MVRLESGLIMKKEKSAVACTMKELVSGIKRITKRNLGSYVIATGVTERARSTYQNVHFTSSELAHLRSGTYYKEREVAQTKNGGNGSHQNTNFPSLQLLKPPCFPCLCLWRADSSSLSTIPLLAKFPPSCWEFAPSAPFHSVWHCGSFLHHWLLSLLLKHSNPPPTTVSLRYTHSLSPSKVWTFDLKHLSVSSFPLSQSSLYSNALFLPGWTTWRQLLTPVSKSASSHWCSGHSSSLQTSPNKHFHKPIPLCQVESSWMLSCCPEETADPNYNFINLSSDTTPGHSLSSPDFDH